MPARSCVSGRDLPLKRGGVSGSIGGVKRYEYKNDIIPLPGGHLAGDGNPLRA